MSIQPGLLPNRSVDTHKGNYGKVFVVAGSVGLSGAAALATKGALRSGAGLVTLGLPKSLYTPLASRMLESMFRLLPETKQGSLGLQGLIEIASIIEEMDAAAIGPGLSVNKETKELVRQLLPKTAKPIVLDADALNAIAEDLGVLKKRNLPLVITPHPGEMGRLIKQSAQDVQKDRKRTAISFANKYNVVVVLKGYKTVVADYENNVYINETGNPAMAAGGFGDVLTGLITGLIAQGLSLMNASMLGVYVHGLAGDIAAKEIGPVGLIATDLIDRIPAAVQQYQLMQA